MKPFILFLYLCFHSVLKVSAQELVCTLNGKKSLNIVSDKFLSFSVDPAVLLCGLHLGTPTMQLVKHLAPGYIRIFGPSTRYLRFSEEPTSQSKDTTLNFTPAMWKSLNDWFSGSGFSPIFTISDDFDESRLTSKTIFPLLELSDEINMHCSWELDSEAARGNLAKYREDLIIFKYFSSMFPNSENAWKIIGPDVNHFLTDFIDNPNNVVDTFDNLTETILWTRAENQISKPQISKNIPIWLITEKATRPITFESAMSWAKTIGEATCKGYEALFREPRLFEMIAETPIFWLTFFHKKLMGRTVLELAPNQSKTSNLSVYCHCTRNQNDFLRRGAITIFAINGEREEKTISLKISAVASKNMEIQSYCFTSNDDNSTTTLLNGEKLNLSILTNGALPKPKFRRARYQKLLTLNLPPKSIGFFVIPDARVTACIDNEDDTNLIIQEIREDQSRDFAQYTHPEISARMKESGMGLKELYLMMEKELETDEKYYLNADGFEDVPPKNRAKVDADVMNKNLSPIVRGKKEDEGKKKNELIQKITEKAKSVRNRLTIRLNVTEALINATDTDRGTLNRKIRDARVGGRGRAGGHGGGRKRITYTTPSSIKALKKTNRKPKRDINMDLLERKAAEVAEKNDSKSRRRSPKTTNYGSILQPEHLYKKEVEKLEVKENPGNRNRDKPIITNFRKKPKQNSEKFQAEDTSKDFSSEDLDEYGDIFDEVGSPNSKYFDEEEIDDDVQSFPVRPTFRIQKPHQGINGFVPKAKEDWLNREIVIEDPEDIEQAIRNLETYLYEENPYGGRSDDMDPFGLDYYDDLDPNASLRYKREEYHGYTEEDVRYYKMLMNSNIKHMRDDIKKQKLRSLPRRKDIKVVNLGQRIENQKPMGRIENQKPMGRIENQKPMGKIKNQKPMAIIENQKPMGNFGLEPIFHSTEQPPLRALPPRVPIRLDENKVRNGIRILKSRLSQHKTIDNQETKPILNIAQPVRRVEEVDEETKQLIKMIKSELRKRRMGASRQKRYIKKDPNRRVDDDVDNTIDSLLEDVNYLVPKLDDTQISLVLPSKDEVIVSNAENETEITFKYLKQRKIEDEKFGTCALTTDDDLTTMATSLGSSRSNNDSIGFNGGGRSSKMQKHSHIQKIKTKGERNPLDQFFKSVTGFIDDVHDKIKSCLTYLN